MRYLDFTIYVTTYKLSHNLHLYNQMIKTLLTSCDITSQFIYYSVYGTSVREPFMLSVISQNIVITAWYVLDIINLRGVNQ